MEGIQVSRCLGGVGGGSPPLLADQTLSARIRKTGTGFPSASSQPERAERNEIASPALRRAVAEGLSGEQRTVFTAVTFHGVPAAALAAAPGSNRNAIYKALFEAAPHPARPPGS